MAITIFTIFISLSTFSIIDKVALTFKTKIIIHIILICNLLNSLEGSLSSYFFFKKNNLLDTFISKVQYAIITENTLTIIAITYSIFSLHINNL